MHKYVVINVVMKGNKKALKYRKCDTFKAF